MFHLSAAKTYIDPLTVPAELYLAGVFEGASIQVVHWRKQRLGGTEDDVARVDNLVKSVKEGDLESEKTIVLGDIKAPLNVKITNELVHYRVDNRPKDIRDNVYVSKEDDIAVRDSILRYSLRADHQEEEHSGKE